MSGHEVARDDGAVGGDSPRRYRWLLHVDLDQFQVAVERLADPALNGRAVIVGGDGDPSQPRKVVTCASYEARAAGVRAGMPLRNAYRKLPEAIYLPLNPPAYDAASGLVMETLRAGGHPVEVWGIDEAYLGVGQRSDVAGTPADDALDDDGITDLAARLRTEVAERTGLSCRIGISDNKQRAKMATAFAKRGVVDALIGVALPPGIFLLDGRNWLALMGASPVRELWSVGPRTAAKLEAMGVSSVSDLIAVSRADLINAFGRHQGNWLYVLCRGGGEATITDVEPDAKSHSRSKTFDADLTDSAEIRAAAEQLADELLDAIRVEGRTASRLALTVRTAGFRTRTRSRVLRPPTTDGAVIKAVIAELLVTFDTGAGVRLLGVRLDLLDRS